MNKSNKEGEDVLANKNIRLYCISVFMMLVFSLCLITATATDSDYDGYIVKLSEPLQLADALSSGDESSVKPLACFDGVYLIDDRDTVDMLVREGLVAYAEPNYILEPLGEAPSDSKYSEQWSLDAINYLAMYGTEYDGSGVTVAVIDSGLDITHPDYVGATIASSSKNFLGDGTHSDAYYRDQLGHGTFVTSQIAAVTNNAEGLAGIADGAELMVLRCVSKNTSEKFLYDAAYDGDSTVAVVSEAICYAADNGADVINISLGMPNSSTTLTDAVNYAHERGIIIVAAVGNSGSTKMLYPANNEHVVGVGSVSLSGGSFTRSSFSQYNTSVDVTAPGGDVLGIQIYPNDDGVWYADAADTYLADSGTSYAAPVVAALAAIVKQINPALDGEDFLSLMTATATNLGTPGYDTSYGYGIVNAESLLDAMTADEYGIEYVLNDSEDSSASLPQNYIDRYKLNREDDLVLPVPKREGYAFAGWYFDTDLSGEAVSVLPVGTLGNAAAQISDETVTGYSISPVTLYAKWEVSSSIFPNEIEYDIYTDEDITVELIMTDNSLAGILYDGSALSEEYYTYTDSAVAVSSAFLHSLSAGVHFLTFDFEIGNDALLQLNVSDSAPRYTVTFYPAFGFESAHYTLNNVRHGSTLGTLPSAPELVDRRFIGWYLEDGTTRITKNAVITSDTDVYAVWTYTGEGEDPGIESSLASDVVITSLSEGAAFEKISQRANGSDFSVYEVSVSGYVPEAGVNVEIAVSYENAYVYAAVGDYLLSADNAVLDGGEVCFKTTDNGIYVISDQELVQYGDANADGKITLLDPLRILKRTADEGLELDVAAADCNQDCSITVLDALAVLHRILNQ